MPTDILGARFGAGKVRRVHMLGVNGISMSGLAEILLSLGCDVSGSDLNASNRTEQLARAGAKIRLGNAASNIDAAAPPDLLVYTAAVAPDNPELVRARELGIPTAERSELLGLIMSAYGLSIGVSGTHGKTTTTSMLASILLAEGLDPTVNNGGEYDLLGGATRVGGGDIFLAEACEYVDTFLKLFPTVAVINNIDYDHSDYFKDLNQLIDSFCAYAMQTARTVVINADDANIAAAVEKMIARGWDRAGPRLRGFGIENAAADYAARDITYDAKHCAAFRLSAPGEGPGARVRLRVPGVYNVYNALAAAAAALEAGCHTPAVVSGLERFSGAKKRFEHLGYAGGVEILDDYAHHPTAVRQVLAAARKYAGAGKVRCVFHPHTYSRTKEFLHAFAEAFCAADGVLVMDIFPAREPDPGDINAQMLVDAINALGGSAVRAPGGYGEIAAAALRGLKPGDILITMGAGLASKVADEALHRS